MHFTAMCRSMTCGQNARQLIDHAFKSHRPVQIQQSFIAVPCLLRAVTRVAIATQQRAACDMNSSGPVSPRRGIASIEKQKPVQMPEVLQNLLVGRIVVKTEAGVEIEGEVQDYATLDIYENEDGNILLQSTWNVEWRDAEDPAERSREILGESVVKTLLTNRFTNATWFLPNIKHLQKAAWNRGAVDASASQHDEAVWLALRNTGIARKACLHAHAMLCALEGGELVIPAPPGVPDHGRAEDTPIVMPQKQYSTLGIAAKGPSPPVAWKMDAPRNVTKKEKRLGRKLAAEAEALREWLKLQKAQLAKVQKRDRVRTKLRRVTARLAEREAALAEWDENNPPEFLSSPETGKGKAMVGGGKLLSRTDVEHSVTCCKKQIRDINASGEVLLSDAAEEAEAERCAQADIAEQTEVVTQVEELVPKAELRLREFEAAMGLTRVRGAGRGVLSMTARVKEPARPRPVPRRKPAAPKAAADGKVKKAKTLPKTVIALGPKLSSATPKKAKEIRTVVLPLIDSDLESDSDGDVMMANPEPSARDTAIWEGEELVHLAGHFFPKRYVMNEGDMPVEEWTRQEATGELEADEYEVDAIVAEKVERKKRSFVVKWKGFELHPEQWLPHADFEACTALDVWEARKAAHASS